MKFDAACTETTLLDNLALLVVAGNATNPCTTALREINEAMATYFIRMSRSVDFVVGERPFFKNVTRTKYYAFCSVALHQLRTRNKHVLSGEISQNLPILDGKTGPVNWSVPLNLSIKSTWTN